jgi:uncharacterized caspase-like protein
VSKCALIVANWIYEDTILRRLVAPSHDAESLAALLRNKSIGAFDQVQVLPNASSSQICEHIESFFDDRARDDLVLFYFSGHGVTDGDGQLYYAASNTLHSRLRSTAIAASWVNDVMNGCRSRKQALLLDCCHSGAVVRSKAGASVNVSKYFVGDSPGGGRGRFILTASDAFQYSFEGDDVEGKGVTSVFTEAVIEGLRTGEADLDEDGEITLDELYSYVYARVREKSSQQTPRKWASDVEGEVVIAANPNPAEALLPDDLQAAIESYVVEAREKAVERLDRLLSGRHRGIALAAYRTLTALANDDSRRVSSAAKRCLAAHKGEFIAMRAESQWFPKEETESTECARDREARREPVAVEMAETNRGATEIAGATGSLGLKHVELARSAAETAKIEGFAPEKSEPERIACERAEARDPRKPDLAPARRFSAPALLAVALTLAVAIGLALSRGIKPIVSDLPVTGTPVLMPVGGAYSEPQAVTILDNTPGAIIHYTLDGTVPTESSAVYSDALTNLPTGTMVRAIAAAKSHKPSEEVQAVYTWQPITQPTREQALVNPQTEQPLAGLKTRGKGTVKPKAVPNTSSANSAANTQAEPTITQTVQQSQERAPADEQAVNAADAEKREWAHTAEGYGDMCLRDGILLKYGVLNGAFSNDRNVALANKSAAENWSAALEYWRQALRAATEPAQISRLNGKLSGRGGIFCPNLRTCVPTTQSGYSDEEEDKIRTVPTLQ